MKKVSFVAIAASAMLTAGLLWSCGEKVDPNVCEAFGECDVFAEACCTTTDCYYTYNGQTFNCNGTDCEEAALQLIAAMCTKKSEAERQQAAKNAVELTWALLSEVGNSSLCR